MDFDTHRVSLYIALEFSVILLSRGDAYDLTHGTPHEFSSDNFKFNNVTLHGCDAAMFAYCTIMFADSVYYYCCCHQTLKIRDIFKAFAKILAVVLFKNGCEFFHYQKVNFTLFCVFADFDYGINVSVFQSQKKISLI